jgi:hypothetical protein
MRSELLDAIARSIQFCIRAKSPANLGKLGVPLSLGSAHPQNLGEPEYVPRLE